MWAQDAAAMYGYAGASASATTLTPFTSPPQSTNSGGVSDQAAAVGQATGTSAGNAQNIVSSVPQTFSAVPNTLQSLATAAPAAAADPPDPLTTLSNLITVFLDAPGSLAGLGVDTPFSIFSYPPDVASYLVGLHTDDTVSGWAGIEGWPGTGPVPPTPFPVITNLGSPVSAGLGEANTVGALSVPPGWAAAAPAIRPLAVALPATSLGAAPEVSAGSSGSLFSQMALASMAGRAMAGTAGSGGPGRRERIGERIRATTHEPTEPPQTPAGGPITGIAAELRELAALRDSGILTDEEFSEQKRLLLPH
jgi:PPE-repeat protein